MKNQFRSLAFLKIKHTIINSENAMHLQSCRQMLENATSILTKDENVILQEYLLSKWDELCPVHFEEEMLTQYHAKNCGVN